MFLVKRIIFTPSVACTMCRNFARFTKNLPDPGISRRKQILGIKENEEIYDLDDLESDFMEVHKSHKEYDQELAFQKEREKYHIIKQKYFKEKHPNFLTWHDKEQIRYLHRTDPEEWTVERLSEGFPALPEVIHKLVKSNWTKTKPHKITNHDSSVQKNWKLFKKGQLPDLPPKLVKHLNKFTSRELNLKPFEAPKPEKNVVQVERKIKSDFSEIIKSYERLRGKIEPPVQSIANVEEKNLTVSKSKHVTFNQLQGNLTRQVTAGENVTDEEKNIVRSVVEKEPEKTLRDEVVDLSREKYPSSTSLQYYKKSEKDLSHLNYPERISIPRRIFRKGSTYKLNDCYYDDDGEFLYRVPGMG